MRKINAGQIQEVVEKLCLKANTELRPDVMSLLKKAYRLEKRKDSKKNLMAILDNAKIAKDERIAICQDTGMVVVHIELGQEVRIASGNLEASVNRGVSSCYRKGYFRKSIVKDPLSRRNTGNNTPCVLYVKVVKGSRIRITVTPKGFGSENKSRMKMFNPTSAFDDIKEFIIDTVKEAGPDACPPLVVGIGMGGTFDKAAGLAKEALSSPITKNTRLEKEILVNINKLGIGPMGLGGKTTALGVNILSYPTHIAGMPVAVNISCHATRGATKVI